MKHITLFLYLCTMCYAGTTAQHNVNKRATGYFSSPGPLDKTHEMSTNPVWPLSTFQNVSWVWDTPLMEYTIYLNQLTASKQPKSVRESLYRTFPHINT